MKKTLYNILRKTTKGNYNFFYNFQKVKNNKITIVNYHGKGYGDNAKYIVEELLKSDFEIVWLLKKEFMDSYLPAGIRRVEYGTRDSLREMATSKIWIDNSRKDYYPPKKKNQVYIQTWHSPLRIKMIEKDAPSLPDSYVRKAKDDAKMTNYMISGSKFSTKLYQESFWYDGKIEEFGTPRCDIFFDEAINGIISGKVKDFYKLPNDKRIVLYAPTFRKSNNMEIYNFDYEKVISSFNKRFGHNYCLIIRLHPNISDFSSEIDYDNNIINGTFYPDMQELLVAADVLITDYSSSMFDMLIAEKKCFLYAADLESYTKNDRGLYFEIKNLPFPFANSSEELISQIENFDDTQYKTSVDKFKQDIGCFEDGKSSMRISKLIKEISNNEKV